MLLYKETDNERKEKRQKKKKDIKKSSKIVKSTGVKRVFTNDIGEAPMTIKINLLNSIVYTQTFR